MAYMRGIRNQRSHVPALLAAEIYFSPASKIVPMELTQFEEDVMFYVGIACM